MWKRQGTRPVDVALKSLTKTSEESKIKFLQEAAIMAQFRHPNVIMLHGMIVNRDLVSFILQLTQMHYISHPWSLKYYTQITLVVELAKRKDLRNFLLSTRPE